MTGDFSEEEEQKPALALRPKGRLDISSAGEMMNQIRSSEGEIELDLSSVESIDLSIAQLIVAVTASLKQQKRPLLVIDSEQGVLRSLLDVSGIRPELAGLSARFSL